MNAEEAAGGVEAFLPRLPVCAEYECEHHKPKHRCRVAPLQDVDQELLRRHQARALFVNTVHRYQGGPPPGRATDSRLPNISFVSCQSANTSIFGNGFELFGATTMRGRSRCAGVTTASRRPR